MTKISALSDIGTSVASNDIFVLVDVSDPTTPNKKIQQQNLFLIPDGSAGTPAVRFLNDTDVGLFRPTTNTLALATGGSERLRIDSSGRVGIGTSSPSNTAGFGQQVEIAGTLPSLTLNQNDAGFTTRKYSLAVNSAGAFGIWDNTPSAYRLYINTSGNVGIGTTSPAYAFVVSAAGASGIEFGPAYSGTANLIQHYSRSGYVYVDAVNDAAQHRFQISGTERARIDSSGRLLVGTSSTSTSHLLKVAGPAQISWFACDTKSATVAPSTTSVLTISNISAGSVAMVKVYIRVYFAANGALNAFFDYDILTSDTGGSGGGAAIRETLNESTGSFQVATGDFAVTRSAGTVTITYTNQASGTNIIDWRVAGLFDTLSIA